MRNKLTQVMVAFPNGEVEQYSNVAGIALVIDTGDGLSLVMATALDKESWAAALDEGADEVRNGVGTVIVDLTNDAGLD